jgi:hypothetical protein
MNEYAYINTSNGLNTKTFDGAMTRGEYISLLTNFIFADYEDEIAEVELTSLTDAGDISYSEAISDATNGVPSDMYETLSKAIALGIIDEDSLEWDSVICKSEAVKLLVSTIKTHNDLTGYAIGANQAWGSGYTVYEDGSYSYDASKDTDGGTDYANHLEQTWIKEEAYKQAGCSSNSEFVETYAPGQGTSEAWRAYALQNGADTTVGSWWVYYNTQAAGDEKSYAINQQTGEKMEAGPFTFFPNGGEFWGYGDEYNSNMEAYILSQ